MKISKETIAALKNFAEINPSVVVSEGSTQKVLSMANDIFARATLSDAFPVTFGVYDLPEFLNVLNMVGEDANIEFDGNKRMLVSDKSGLTLTYVLSPVDNIVPKIPEKEIEDVFPEADVTVTITGETLARVRKVASTLGVDDVAIRNVDGKIVLVVTDLSCEESNSAHKFTIPVCDYDGEANFSFNFKVERFKVIEGDYEVEISSKFISKWENLNSDFVYLIALERNSTFEE